MFGIENTVVLTKGPRSVLLKVGIQQNKVNACP